MTLEEQCRLSYYQKIAEISEHKNVSLVQHTESKKIYVQKCQKIYDKHIYEFLMQWNNPHIPKIYECVESDDMLIIIEEYVQGMSLAEHLQDQGVYSETEAVRIITTICDVLAELHGQSVPIIHRDIKPENIIIQDNGNVKMIDFNTAKQYQEGKENDTVIIGTRDFAAPEQFGFAQSDARTDIYAIGVLLNYLLTMELPKNKLYYNEKSKNKSITHVIKMATQFNPMQRYQNVQQIRKALTKKNAPQNNNTPEKNNASKKHYFLNEDSSEDDDKSRKGWWYHPYLPPGFRSGTLWKMVVALLGYLMTISIAKDITLETEGVPVTGAALYTYRIMIAAGILLSTAFCTNYLGMQHYFPMMKRLKYKWIGYIVYPIIIFFMTLLIAILVEAIL